MNNSKNTTFTPCPSDKYEYLKHIMKFLHTLVLLTLTTFGYSQTGIIKGSATDALTNEPIIFANVLLVGTTTGTNTDELGNYEFTNLEPGIYDVQLSYIGYQTLTQSEQQVQNNRPTTVNFLLELDTETLDEVTIKADAFKKPVESPVSLRTIGVTEIKRRPGGNRDISRVIQSLPGVTSTASFRNDLIIRGGSPNENRFYLDDVEVPNINHFATQGASGGPAGIINVDFIREVDFYSGAFPANRGNSLSSVFQFKQKDGRSDRLGMTATVGATDIGVSLEGPIGEKTTFLFSARRSYLQFVFEAIGLPFLPIYNDFQAKVKYKPNNKEEWTFIGLGAIDNFELNLDADPTESNQFILENIPVNNQWNYTNGIVYKRFNDTGFTTFVLSRNMLNNEATKYFQNDDSTEDNLLLRYKSQEIENKFRVERSQRFGTIKAVYGAGTQYVKYNNSTQNQIFTAGGPVEINFASDLDFFKYSAFGQVSKDLLDNRLTLSAGVRVDGNTYSDDMSNPLKQFSPRVSASYAVNELWSVNANVGSYTQLPSYTVLGYEENNVLINKENDLTFIRANHAVAGIEWNTGQSSRITLEGYIKEYDNYPFLLRDSISLANLGGDFGVVGNEPAVSTSIGRTYGMEFLFQQRLYKGWYGILAYTLGWSEFQDKNGIYLPSAWDSRHIINTTIGKSFGKNWEAGVNIRMQSGLPTTPADPDASLVQNWNINNFARPNYDLINSERNKAFGALDFRVDKKWFFDKWSLNLYFDLQNLVLSDPGSSTLILDRELDENGFPIGDGVITNPMDPIGEQRYLLKSVENSATATTPSIGVVISI